MTRSRCFPLFVPMLLMLATLPARAQAPATWTLGAAIERAQAASPQAQQARLQYEQAQWDHVAFRARYRPGLTLSGDAPGLRRSITDVLQDDGSIRYVEQSQTFATARLSVSQTIPYTGGQVFVFSALSRANSFGTFDRSEWQSTPLLVGLTQPLGQFNDDRWNLRTEPLRFRLARRAVTAGLAEVAVEATERFFAVYLAEMNVDILAFNVAVNDTVFTLSQGRFEIGRIAENDLLQSELQLLNAQTALANARIAYERAMQDLRRLLRLPYDAPVEVTPPLALPAVAVDPQEAVARALTYRADVLGLELDALQADREVARARRSSGLQATLNASYGLNQTGAALDDAYTDPRDQQRLTVGFSIPVFQWGQNRAAIAAARAAQAETEAQIDERRTALEQEVYFEALQFRQLQQQVAVAAQADTVAARRFEVARNRYAIGTIDITELFNAQREKDQARRAYVETLRAYWASYYRLRRLTLYDFVRNEPLRSGG